MFFQDAPHGAMAPRNSSRAPSILAGSVKREPSGAASVNSWRGREASASLSFAPAITWPVSTSNNRVDGTSAFGVAGAGDGVEGFATAFGAFAFGVGRPFGVWPRLGVGVVLAFTSTPLFGVRLPAGTVLASPGRTTPGGRCLVWRRPGFTRGVTHLVA